MANDITSSGYFSVLRWRGDVTRDEAKNVAVVVVGRDGEFGGIRSAPISSISARLHEQGLLDSMVTSFETKFLSTNKPRLSDLAEMHESFRHSLILTEPSRVSVPDLDSVLDALYRAYAAPRYAGGGSLTKGVVTDQVVAILRKSGFQVSRGSYVQDFLFDIVIEPTIPDPPLIGVMSFATQAKDWSNVEHDAGHFLYALERVGRPGIAVVQPPSEASHKNATTAHDRVQRWLTLAHVKSVRPKEVASILTAVH